MRSRIMRKRRACCAPGASHDGICGEDAPAERLAWLTDDELSGLRALSGGISRICADRDGCRAGAVDQVRSGRCGRGLGDRAPVRRLGTGGRGGGWPPGDQVNQYMGSVRTCRGGRSVPRRAAGGGGRVQPQGVGTGGSVYDAKPDEWEYLMLYLAAAESRGTCTRRGGWGRPSRGTRR